jgi:hypothetical protein
VTPDADLVEVGAPQHLSGRFKRGSRALAEPTLAFVTEKGHTFLVANGPGGASVDCTLNILASPVTLSPSWGIGAACGLWVHDNEDIWGTIDGEGIRLWALPKTWPDFVAWGALEAVVRVRYPLSIHYQLELRDGSAARVDFLDEERLVRQLKEHRVGFRCCEWTGTEAL